ncbi:MAG: FAD-dependent oxidoreductase [Patescibacteria group bacterium]|nr:FAD-dependent oxidoreductase [Patescibacteria group bacterium]
MKNYDFIVLGAGLAGLSFGYKMSKAGYSVLLLEKEDTVGGLSRTFEHDGFKFDLCAHRFHSSNKDLLDEVLRLPGIKWNEYSQKSRIFMFDKYLKYPFELQNLLRAMPITESFVSGLSFGYNLLKKQLIKKRIVSYKDWFEFYFGHKLYTIMCLPYTSKIWKIDPSLLSADWAGQRFQGVKIKELMKKIMRKISKLDFSSYSLEDEELAPDGGKFYYPETGIQELPDSLAKLILTSNSEIKTNIVLNKINDQNKEVCYKENGSVNFAKANKALINTIPLHTFYNLCTRKNKDIEKCLNELKYMDIVFVYLFLNKKNISNDHWLYFSDKDIIFNRSVEFRNWSKKMVRDDKTAICLDITCYEGDGVWKMKDEDIAERSINDAIKVRLISKSDVFDSKVIRLKNAYPFYDLGYKEKLLNVVNFFEKTGSTYCLGRTGIFNYNNADNSIEVGFELARKLIDGKRSTMFGYVSKYISY